MASEHGETQEQSRIRTHRTLVAVVVIGILLAVAYAVSALAYGAGLNKTFVTPTPPAGGIAISLLPIRIDADAQVTATDVLIFPDRTLLDDGGRLLNSIQVDVYPTAAGGTVMFREGTVPSPQKVEVPILGLVQRYPFDSYSFSAQVSSLQDQGTRADPLAVAADVFFKVPGWQFTGLSTSPAGRETATASGTISRSTPIITIAVIFIALILMMGVLAVLTVVAGVRGRGDLGISQAAWLTSATFALIALRNAFPGSPPLGSWLDILVYFWVITAIMLMIGLAGATILLRQHRHRD